jgi:imidazolonepropionase-like amidohydrolase
MTGTAETGTQPIETGVICRRDFAKLTLLSVGALLGCKRSPETEAQADDAKSKTVSYPKTLLHNFRMFDNVHLQLQTDLLIVIEGDRIAAIEPLGDLDAYRGFQRIDLGGRTVLPGLIDNHVHITVPFMYDVNLSMINQMNDQIALNFKNCIMNGVTTVRDVGGFPDKINTFRGRSDRNEIPGPRVISSLSPIAARKGKILGAPEKAPYFSNPVVKWLLGGNYAERPQTVREIEVACDEMIEKGAQWLKTLHQDESYSRFPRPRQLPNHTDEGYRVILKKGEENGIKCALHEPFLSGFRKGVDLGFHTLEHMPHDQVIPAADIELFITRGMAILPTMMVYADIVIERELLQMIADRGREILMPEAIEQMSAKLQASVSPRSGSLSESQIQFLQSDRAYMIEKLPNMRTNLHNLYRMGATIGIGTDIGGAYACFFGRYTDELKHFSAAGIPNFDILCQATSINARIIDRQADIGTLERGKLADMIAVQGNPLQDLSTLDTVDLVMKGGAIIKQDGILSI